MKEFLEQNRAEAMAMSIYEYDEEKHIRMEREDAYADGHKDGHKDGQNRMLTLVQKMMEDGMTEKIPQLTTSDFLEEMLKKYEL
ncbi:MAG: hypothetical protein IJB84_06735 [Lachnospiraceae bacterium]|nr:hypothetical protein [Lachnospiraceae bacterium]